MMVMMIMMRRILMQYSDTNADAGDDCDDEDAGAFMNFDADTDDDDDDYLIN